MMRDTRKAAPLRKAYSLGMATLAASGLAAALPQAARAQTTVTWTGSGHTGTDPYGQPGSMAMTLPSTPGAYYWQLPAVCPRRGRGRTN